MLKQKENQPIAIMISWLAVTLWMILIFCLSSQAAEQSSKLSSGITAMIIDIIQNVFPKARIDIHSFGHMVRKLAHFFSYLVLGVLVLNAFTRCGWKGYKSVLLSAGVCILYAVSDEIHQLYVPGRSGQIRDVLIDSAGAFTGFVFYAAASKWVKRKKGYIPSVD